jgi:hypothetical protein
MQKSLLKSKGQVPVINKILVGNTILEQVNKFTYLGHKFSCEGKEMDRASKTV